MALDANTQPMAETCRQAARYAESLGLARPSYVHMRRFLRELRDEREAERARREAIGRALADAAWTVAAGRVPHAYELAERVERETRGS